MLHLTQVSWPRLLQAGLSLPEPWTSPPDLPPCQELHPKTFYFNLLTPEITTSSFWDRPGNRDPLLQCCNTCNRTYLSWNNKIQRNCMELHACAVGANSEPQRYKETKNPTANLEELGAKSSICACPLHETPPKGWAKHLSHLPSLTPEYTSILTPYKEKACPSLGASQ